jgi:hypothetical protein
MPDTATPQITMAVKMYAAESEEPDNPRVINTAQIRRTDKATVILRYLSINTPVRKFPARPAMP